MRIITGKARGLKLRTPAGLSTRPTSDRVKESLFSILGGLIDFAGNVTLHPVDASESSIISAL